MVSLRQNIQPETYKLHDAQITQKYKLPKAECWLQLEESQRILFSYFDS